MSTHVINARYDAKMHYGLTREFYAGSDFYNFGYWTDRTANAREASESLMEKLLSTLPRKDGTILDVACGLGGTTRHLLRYYEPGRVTGINVSEAQLETCRQHVPGCTFLKMDATKLAFPDASFDNILCVEAVFHFRTRQAFLREACRVLKRGGRLVLSDILVARWAAMLNPRIPAANYVRDLDAYRALYREAGFDSVEVLDTTVESWKRFYARLAEFRRRKRLDGQIGWWACTKGKVKNRIADWGLRHYLLVAAGKG